VYVHPEEYEDTFSPRLDEFESEVIAAIEQIGIEDESGLEARPKPAPEKSDGDLPKGSRCGSCPYALSRGGPCQYG
jgi:hypothetical protein